MDSDVEHLEPLGNADRNVKWYNFGKHSGNIYSNQKYTFPLGKCFQFYVWTEQQYLNTISKGTYENIVTWQNLSGIFKQTPKSPRGWVEVNIYTIFIMKSPRNIFLLLHFMYITTLSTMKLTLLLAEVLLLQNQTQNQALWLRIEYPAKTMKKVYLRLYTVTFC